MEKQTKGKVYMRREASIFQLTRADVEEVNVRISIPLRSSTDNLRNQNRECDARKHRVDYRYRVPPEPMTRVTKTIKPLRLIATTFGIITASAACLSDEPREMDQTNSIERSGSGQHHNIEPSAIPSLPAGAIVDTQVNSGWTEGSFSVSGDGAANYHLPLWVPDGRRGLQPDLALHYSSGAGNGLLGVGWSLSGLSSIRPCRRTWAEDGVNENPAFTGLDAFCLDGQRLRPLTARPSPSQVEYRTEKDTFARIISTGSTDPLRQPTEFKVWTKDGRVLTYGGTIGNNPRLQAYTLSGAQPEDPVLVRSTDRVTAAWAVTRIEDRNGNVMNVSYKLVETSGNRWAVEYLPSEITYAAGAPDRKVEFIYERRCDPIDESRCDPIDGFQAGKSGGVHTWFPSRLKTIKMWSGTELLREYRLAYENNSITARSLLASITECDAMGVCLNPLEFEWSLGKNDPEIDYEFEVTDHTNINDVGTYEESRYSYTPGDINGDGKDDVVYADQNNNWKMRRSTGNGFEPARATGIPRAGDGSFRPRLRSVDYDRDGRMDLLAEVPCPGCNPPTRFALYHSIGTSYELFPNLDDLYTHPVNGVWNPFFIDMDGNGSPDYVAPRFDQSLALRWRYRLNRGGEFAPLVETDLISRVPPTHSWTNFPTRATSLHGDGTSNLLIWGNDTNPSDPEDANYDAVQLTSSGLSVVRSNLNLPFQKRPENGSDQLPSHTSLQFADVNGDGLQDAIYITSGLRTQLNTGAGFSDIIPGPTEYEDPVANLQGYTPGFRIVDFNNDGADDILILHWEGPPFPPDHVWKTGWHLYTWRNGGFVRVPVYPGVSPNSQSGIPVFEPIQPLDFNGDGMMDIACVVRTSGFLVLRTLKRKGRLPDKLVRVKVAGLGPSGASSPRVEVDYTTLADRAYHTPGPSAVYPFTWRSLTRGGTIVAKHRMATSDGDTRWNEFTHSYTGARVDIGGRGWLGVEEHTVSLLTNSITTTTSFLNNVVAGSGPYLYPYVHLPKQTTYAVVNSDGSRYEHTVTKEYSVRGAGAPNAHAIFTSSVTESDREKPSEGTWTELHSRATSLVYDEYGNTTNVTIAVPGSDRVIDLSYKNDPVNWLIQKRTARVTTDCLRASNVCETRESQMGYQPNGNLSIVVHQPFTALSRRTDFEYGTYGNITAVTTSDGTGEQRRVELTYDAGGLYPKTVTNDLGHTAEVNVHPGLGVPLDSYDANRVPTTRKFDRFGRLREVNYADGFFVRFTTSGPLIHVTTVATGIDTVEEGERVILDELGREVEHRVLAFGGGFSTNNTAYDRFGQIAKSSRPYLLGSGATVYYTTFSYDLRGRLTRVVEPDGATTSHEYVGLVTSTYDPKGTKSRVVERADGRIESRAEDDPKSTSLLSSGFEYGPFGLLSKVVGPDGKSQTMKYDAFGRRIEHVDSSTGRTTTSYNAFGEVIQEVNGANESTTFSYDAIGRPITITSPDGTTTYAWDPTKQKGKLLEAESAEGVVTRHEYDDIGRNTKTTWIIEGTPYQLSLDYDEIGRPNTMTYPAFPGVTARLMVKYTYTPTGYLKGIENAQNAAVYWQVNQRNAAGKLEVETYGSGATAVTGRCSYSPITGLLENIRSDGPSGQLDLLQYGYDLNRNVTLRQDFVGDAAKTQTYVYDTLNRLMTWKFWDNPGAVVTTDFDYSSVGNLLGETVSGRTGMDVISRYGEGGAPPHALSSRNNVLYTYDGAGRQKTGPNRAVTYNRFGLPKVLTRTEGQATTFLYDAEGARVLKRDSAQTIITVGAVFERQVASGAVNLHYLMADGRPVAQVKSTQTVPTGPVTETDIFYLHSDGQGSIIQTTDSTGAIAEEFFYDPFGRRTDENYNPLTPQNRSLRRGYTGHEHDDELALVNMQGRVYDPEARRFLTPDPIDHPLSSQGHNRYIYVFNNPATLIDPTGFGAEDWQPDCSWVGPVCIGGEGDQSLPPGGDGGDNDGDSGAGSSDDSDIHNPPDQRPHIGTSQPGRNTHRPGLGPHDNWVELNGSGGGSTTAGRNNLFGQPPDRSMGELLDDPVFRQTLALAWVLDDSPANFGRPLLGRIFSRWSVWSAGGSVLGVGGVSPWGGIGRTPFLPKWEGGKTLGWLRIPAPEGPTVPDSFIPIQSGRNGPASRIPAGTSGFDRYVRDHAEGNAAALMRERNIPQAMLYINKEEICSNCSRNLPYALGLGRRLTIVTGDGTEYVFEGVPAP